MVHPKTRSETSRRDINEVRSLLNEASSIQSNARIEKMLLQYDALKIIESMDLTVAQKARMSGIAERNYQYSRRVVRDFSNRNEFREYLEQQPNAISILKYKGKPQARKVDLMTKFKDWLRRKDLNLKSEEFINLLRGLNLQVSYVTPINSDAYFRNRPCIVCGDMPFENQFELYEHKDTGVFIPICDKCYYDGLRVDDREVIKMMALYSEDLYKAYKELLKLI